MIEPKQAGLTIDQAWLDRGSWEVDIAGKRYPAVCSLRPLYDPDNARIKM
jgi:4-methylaminobutanoate oxidase (formaldehyde-forming)